MAPILFAALLCWPGFLLRAQTRVPPPRPLSTQTVSGTLRPAELAKLLAPIALYPDALIALILPASTVPTDVVLASRYLKSHKDLASVDGQSWDESVKSLTHHPDVLALMNENLEWTTSMGKAFILQPADVLAAVQTLRDQARAAGNLVNTPRQNVSIQQKIIHIAPADPDVIYVPAYDPGIVYSTTYVANCAPLLIFSVGCRVGPRFNDDFDWNKRCRSRGNWQGWHNRHWNNQQQLRLQQAASIQRGHQSWTQHQNRQTRYLHQIGRQPGVQPQRNQPHPGQLRPSQNIHESR